MNPYFHKEERRKVQVRVNRVMIVAFLVSLVTAFCICGISWFKQGFNLNLWSDNPLLGFVAGWVAVTLQICFFLAYALLISYGNDAIEENWRRGFEKLPENWDPVHGFV